ncbi:DUF4124 domain-containing protein [Alkalimarinus sediminis]|uniref:DUF4124 domain-containing protein n=1 Tax=Alkalimarinus sediminis TaxID=1632866 RepID=A0A9E8KQ66_9ALTE|nr:DUF4124 domain-containing protein [Alkalimarinus sediminis]UZW75454.1 DUF4124 domain-containing protein [Alkalimarinus sediminis]
MNSIKTSILLSALVALSAPTHADIYKSVNDEGVVEYSDQPREGSEKIKVKNPQSITLPKAADVFSSDGSSTDTTADSGALYQRVTITQPANESAFNSGNGLVSVSSETTPALQPGHSLQLVMDGTPYNSNTSGSFGLSNVDRGTHQLQVNVIDSEGKTIISSDVTTFTLHRPQAPRKTPRAN